MRERCGEAINLSYGIADSLQTVRDRAVKNTGHGWRGGTWGKQVSLRRSVYGYGGKWRARNQHRDCYSLLVFRIGDRWAGHFCGQCSGHRRWRIDRRFGRGWRDDCLRDGDGAPIMPPFGDAMAEDPAKNHRIEQQKEQDAHYGRAASALPPVVPWSILHLHQSDTQRWKDMANDAGRWRTRLAGDYVTHVEVWCVTLRN